MLLLPLALQLLSFCVFLCNKSIHLFLFLLQLLCQKAHSHLLHNNQLLELFHLSPITMKFLLLFGFFSISLVLSPPSSFLLYSSSITSSFFLQRCKFIAERKR